MGKYFILVLAICCLIAFIVNFLVFVVFSVPISKVTIFSLCFIGIGMSGFAIAFAMDQITKKTEEKEERKEIDGDEIG